MPEFLTFTPAQRKELGRQIEDDWTADQRDRETWLADLPRWLKAYQGRVEAKDVPWAGASNLHVPVTRTVIDAIHPRIMSALWRPTPICAFRPQEPADQDLARRRERFLDWAAREEVRLFPVMDRVIWGALVYGVQLVKITWELRCRSLKDVQTFPADLPIEQIIEAVVAGTDRYVEALERVNDTDYQGLVKQAGKTPTTITATHTASGWKVTTTREEVTHDAPMVTLVDPEDWAVNADCPPDLQEADHLFHRYRLSLDAIKRKRKAGQFQCSEEDLETLDHMATSSEAPDDTTYEIKQARGDVVGVELPEREGAPTRVTLLDCYVRYDHDDDGLEEDLLVTVPLDKPDLFLRAVRLEEVYRHGYRPFVCFALYPLGETVWAPGLPQILEGVQLEFNTIHNQRVDAGTVANTPWFWYEPGPGQNPEKTPIVPGYGIPVADVAKIKEHQPSNVTAWAHQEESTLWMLTERLTKANDLTFGRVGETQGAARTASGVQALSQQQATGFDILIRRAQESFRLLLQQIQALYAQYLPPGKEMRVLGPSMAEPPTLVSRDDLRTQMDLEFTGNALSTDREIERNTLTFMAQSVMAPQTMQFLMQLGIMTPQGIAEWYAHLMDVFDVPHRERILQVPKGPSMATVDDIVSRCLAGERLAPMPGEDHQGVIARLVALLSSPEAVTLSPEARLVLTEQLARRQSQLQQEAMAQQIVQAMMPPPPGPGISMPGQGGAPIPLPATAPRLAM